MTVTERRLTQEQQRLLESMRAYWREHGFSPSIRDLQDACGYRTPSAVVYQLRVLQASGLVTHEPGVPRALALLGGGPCPCCGRGGEA